MNPADSLPLRDIHLPDPVSWWPPAMGWWFLLLFSLIVMWLLIVLIKKLRKPVLKKSARAEVVAVIEAYHNHQDKHLLIQQLSVTLKRIGISYLQRNEMAGLSGIEWYTQINSLVEKNKFSEDVIRLLSQGPYQKKPELDGKTVNDVIQQSRLWVSALSREKPNA
ncbi:MAG: DUF4381 domain-containing protein [Gammaproteobacteria bacterium]|nr:DUF4381 domain-containing protein [Gammaproteobacteria bacterium]